VSVARWLIAAALVTAAHPVLAQRYLLEVRPRVGDTLRVVLEHRVTVRGGAGRAADTMALASANYRIVTREIVESSTPSSVRILAIVDTARMTTTGVPGAIALPVIPREVEGAQVRLQITPDGSARILDSSSPLSADLRAVLGGAMPGLFPPNRVGIGDVWERSLPLAADVRANTFAVSGVLHARLRLDSLTDRGARAWVSLDGALDPAALTQSVDGKGAYSAGRTNATLSGWLVLDLTRGWVAQSVARVTMESPVAVAGGRPMSVRVHVDQILHTIPR
jgi:hypothetical protein